MKSGETLRVLYWDWLPRFEIEYYFVFGAVILEHPPHILHPGHHGQKTYQDDDTNHSVRQSSRGSSGQDGIETRQLGHSQERHELLHEDEERQREQKRGHPTPRR